MPCPQFPGLSFACFLPGSVLGGTQPAETTFFSALLGEAPWGQSCLFLLSLIAGLMTLESIRNGLFWTPACFLESLISFGPETGRLRRKLAAEAPERTIWLTVSSLIAVLAVVKPPAVAGRKLQKGGHVHLGSTGGPAIPRTLSRALRSAQGALALQLKLWKLTGDGKRGWVWEKRQHHRFLEKRGRAWFLLLLALISLSFVVILDKDDDGAGASFVPSVIPNIWRTEW